MPDTDSAASILAWCDHIEKRAKGFPRAPYGTPRRLYEDGFLDGTIEVLAQVRQAVVHDFDIGALDGQVLT